MGIEVTEQNDDNVETTDNIQVEDGKFTRRELRNKNRPKSEANPLTVIEFSLTNEIKTKLKRRLRPYVEGDRVDEVNNSVLKRAAEDCIPQEVLDYFRSLDSKHSQNITPNVYVIYNLPEVKKTKEFSPDLLDNSYAELIGNGIALAIDKKHNMVPIDRAKDCPIIGNPVHKHDQEISGLSGLYNRPGTNTPTRFINLIGALNDAGVTGEDKGLKPDKLLINRQMHLGQELLGKYGVTQEIIDKRSLDVELKHGSLALWSEKGKAFHQALPTQMNGVELDAGKFVRLAGVHFIGESSRGK